MQKQLVVRFGGKLLQVPASMHHKLESLASRRRNMRVWGAADVVFEFVEFFLMVSVLNELYIIVCEGT